jgi:hypothetical protein
MASPDLMNDPEVIAELHRLADACDRLSQAVARAPGGSGSAQTLVKSHGRLTMGRPSWPK